MNQISVFIVLFSLLIVSCTPDSNSTKNGNTGKDTLPDLANIDQSQIGNVDTIRAKSTYIIDSDPAIDRAKLYDKVMDIHDEVMPKMSSINKIKLSLGSRLKNDKNLDPKTTKVINDLIAKMDAASEAMFGWMHQFKSPEGRLSHEEAMKYLNEEKVKITEVKEQILNTIEEGLAFTGPIN